jgi:hypothetical protein
MHFVVCGVIGVEKLGFCQQHIKSKDTKAWKILKSGYGKREKYL